MTSRWVWVLVAVTSLAAACGRDSQEGGAKNLAEDEATSTTAGEIMGTSVGKSDVMSEPTCEVEGGIDSKGTDVTVALSEWKIDLTKSQVPAGIVSFVAENTGRDEHEMVVVKTDSADALPTDADGAMDESKLPEGALVGEIEPMAAAQLCRGNFPLQAGQYVLLCNVVDKEEGGVVESHFAEGMHTPFTVGS
jgi:hypothetical protein